jgi:adenylate cyclase
MSMAIHLKHMWFNIGMVAIGAVLVIVPWMGEWQVIAGQRLLLIVLPCLYLGLYFVKYSQINRHWKSLLQDYDTFSAGSVIHESVGNVQIIQKERQTVYGICMITDAKGYTAVSESLTSSNLTDVMNRYFESIFEPIKSYGGKVVQVAGDSVLSLWTAVGPGDKLEIQACESARAIQEAVECFNSKQPEYALPTRVGIHSGYFALDNIGALDHFEFRPVGDIVNTASRLEGLNKLLGTNILVSEDIARHLPVDKTRCVGRFIFKGKSSPTVVHELLTTHSSDKIDRQSLNKQFDMGLGAFQKGLFDEAEDVFQTIISALEMDGPSKYYLEEISRLRSTGSGAYLDGTIVLDQK